MAKKGKVWGFLREDEKSAKEAGIDKETGLPRTSLLDYLLEIFPETKPSDWIHDKQIGKGDRPRIRPDYRNESKRLIVEFDGVQHYTDWEKSREDREKDEIYRALGYKVVRIPFFIQLTRKTAQKLFGESVKDPLFDEKIPSFGESNAPGRNFCLAGLTRAARDFLRCSKEQYRVNIAALRALNDEELSGAKLLETEYTRLSKAQKAEHPPRKRKRRRRHAA